MKQSGSASLNQKVPTENNINGQRYDFDNPLLAFSLRMMLIYDLCRKWVKTFLVK